MQSIRSQAQNPRSAKGYAIQGGVGVFYPRNLDPKNEIKKNILMSALDIKDAPDTASKALPKLDGDDQEMVNVNEEQELQDDKAR